MAKMVIKMPEDFLIKLSNLGSKTDVIITKVLEEGSKVLESEVRSNLQIVIGKKTKLPSKSTGELLASLGTSSVRQDKNGNYNIKVGFDEDRPDGKSNAMIANILEYGKSDQQAKPFLKPALRKSKQAVMDTMVRTLDEEVNKL